MLKTITTLLLLIISNYSLAGSIYYGLHTDHVLEGDFNEKNELVIAHFDSGLTVGSMTNSYNRPSTLFGYVQPNKPIALGIVFATGYKPENLRIDDYVSSTPLIPMPLLSINIPTSDSVSVTSNIIGGFALNTGLKISF